MWRIFLGIALLALGACSSNSGEEWVAEPPSLKGEVDFDPLFFNSDAERTLARKQKRFAPLLAAVTDSSAFLRKLIQTYRPQTTTQAASLHRMEKQALFGRSDSIWVLDVRWPAGSCSRHRQFIFSGKAQLLEQTTAQTWSFYYLLNGELPFLVMHDAPCGGEGTHQILRGTEAGLMDVFNPLTNTTLFTVDALPNASINEPSELKLLIADENQDGWNDVLFLGERLHLEDPQGAVYTLEKPYRREELRWVFLYHPVKQQFLAAENYQ